LPTEHARKTHTKYPTRHIQTDLHLFCGSRDTISDIDYLERHLPAGTKIHTIDDYEHMDFLWAENAREDFWERMLSVLQRDVETRNAVSKSSEV
jgi:lysosomal acid lipase/cholesteryl ester hydrolase